MTDEMKIFLIRIMVARDLETTFRERRSLKENLNLDINPSCFYYLGEHGVTDLQAGKMIRNGIRIPYDYNVEAMISKASQEIRAGHEISEKAARQIFVENAPIGIRL